MKPEGVRSVTMPRSCSGFSTPRAAPIQSTGGAKRSAIARLTAGPARAIASSRRGSTGSCSIRATPPIGSSVMSRTPTP